jgi:hypothetical protein
VLVARTSSCVLQEVFVMYFYNSVIVFTGFSMVSGFTLYKFKVILWIMFGSVEVIITKNGGRVNKLLCVTGSARYVFIALCRSV